MPLTEKVSPTRGIALAEVFPVAIGVELIGEVTVMFKSSSATRPRSPTWPHTSRWPSPAITLSRLHDDWGRAGGGAPLSDAADVVACDEIEAEAIELRDDPDVNVARIEALLVGVRELRADIEARS